MQKSFWAKVTAFIKQYHVRKSWRRAVSALTCVVVFCTTYALILPAITMEGVYSCGLKEHVHSEACQIHNSDAELTCTPGHSHDPLCYGEDGSLICGLADFVLHSHDRLCYREDGSLLCQLLQVTEHANENGVFYVVEGSDGPNTAAHIHSKSCYVQARGEQSCVLTEGEAHIHDADCYDADQINCQLEEKEGHQHSDECDTVILICEEAGHAHGAACYLRERTCGQTEDGHTHTDTCRQPALICTLSDAVHTHIDSCFELRQEITCGKLTLTAHTHSEDCLRTQAEVTLVCGQEEHLHTLICYSDPTADLESKDFWEATMEDADLTGTTAENLLTIAKAQLGYTESKLNYTVQEDGITLKGYTRYGAWAGTPYADWNELFLEFCLHYAGIEAKDFPRAEENKTWAETLSAHGLTYTTDGTPIPGDLIFLNIEDTDYTGIVTAVSEEYVTVILGDYKNEVRSETLTLADEDILGYALLPELEEEDSRSVTETLPQSTEEPVTDVYNEPLRADIDLGTLSASQTPENTVAAFSLRNSGIQTYAEEAADTTTYPDMAEFIESLAILYKQPGEGSWTPVINGMVLDKGTELRYELTYTIDKGTLDATENIVTYKLPVKMTTLEGTGFVTSSGTNVGTYVIDENGLMTITFYPQFAAQNVGKDITGTIFFEASLKDYKADDDGSIHLGTDEGESYTVTIKEETSSAHDIKVSKEATNVDEEKGIITYRITVQSEKGTPDEITLTDTMNNATYIPGTLKVYKNDNETIEDIQPEQSSNREDMFGLSALPKLEAGEYYTIEYQAKVTNASQGSTGVGNYVNVTSSKDNDRVQDSQYIGTNISFGDNPLNKTHKVNQDGTVEWTITIDTSKIDPSGWTLSDTMSEGITNITLEYTVIENNAVVTKTETIDKLPYKFEGGEYRGFITVTYSSEIEYVLGQNGVYNSATITPPEGQFNPPYSEGENAPYPEGSYNVVDKKLYKQELDDTHRPTKLIWQLTIGPNYEQYNESWTLTDTLSAHQYYTDDQKTVIKEQIQTMLAKIYPDKVPAYDLEFTGEYVVGEATYPTGFELEVNAPLPEITREKAVTIEYSSTPDIGNGDTQMYLSNTVNFDGQTQDIDGMNYNPILNKWGSDWWSSALRVFDKSNGELPDQLVWHVQLKITDEMKQSDKPIIITEDIPDDVRLVFERISFAHSDEFQNNVYASKLENGQKIELTYPNSNGKITVEKQDSDTGDKKILITLPADTVNQLHMVDFAIYFDLPSDFIPTKYPDENYEFMYDSFTNTVSVNIEGEKPIAEDHQTQVIIDPSITKDEDREDIETVLKYMAPEKNDKKNQKSYVIQVNHNAEDLAPGSDWLKVNDVLSFTNTINQNGQKIFANLLPDTVKISIYDADGNPHVFSTASGEMPYVSAPLAAYTGVELMESELTVPGTYTTSIATKLDNEKDPKAETTEYTIDFYVPDGCYVRLEYDYEFSGAGEVRVKNVAKVTSYGTEHKGDSETGIDIGNSGMTADVGKLNIKKVDSNNNNRALPNAIYELYAYVPCKDAEGNETDEWEWAYQYIARSDENGELVLGGDTVDAEGNQIDIDHLLNTETFYYLVEIQAPVEKDAAGNILHQYVLDQTRHYFLIKDRQEGTPTKPETPPSDFPANAYYPSGYTMLIENEYAEKSVSVDKKWLNADGTEMAAPPAGQQITVALEQYLTYDQPGATYDYGQKADVKLQVGDNSYLQNVFMSTLDQYAPVRTDADGEAYQNIVVGDVITITYKNLAIDPTSAEENLPGLMNFTTLDGKPANMHVPYKTEKNAEGGWDYIFQLRVRAYSDLRGWTYGAKNNGVEISVNPYDPTKPNPGGKQDTTVYNGGTNYYYKETIFQGDDWSEIWTGLPKYYLDDHGRKLGYYIYELQEVTVGDYVTDIDKNDDGTVNTIINKIPSDMDLTVEKQWPDGPGANKEIQFNLYQVTHESKPEYVDVAYKVWNRDSNTVYQETTQKLLVGSKARISFDGLWVGIEVNGVQTIWYGELGSYTEEIEITKETKSIVVNIPGGLSASAVSLGEVQNGVTQAIDKCTLSAANDWRHVFENLPLEAMVEVKDADGNTTKEHVYYSYYIKEVPVDGYTTSYEVQYGGVTYQDGDYIPTYTLCPTVTQDGTKIIISNEKDDSYVWIDVQKEWVTSTGEWVDLNSVTNKKIEFDLFKVESGESTETGDVEITIETKDGYKETKKYAHGTTLQVDLIGSSASTVTDFWGNTTISLKSEAEMHMGTLDINGWVNEIYKRTYQITLNGTGNGYVYIAYGVDPGSYTMTDGTNIDIGMIGEPTVVTSFDDDSEASMGEKIARYEISTPNWTTHLGPLAPGTYRIQEILGAGDEYTVKYYVDDQEFTTDYAEAKLTGGETVSIVIQNQIPDDGTTQITVKKDWAVPEGAETPDSITFKLLQNGVEMTSIPKDDDGNEQTLEITADGNWTKTITNLPLVDADGNAYTYTVEEVAIDGYTTSYSTADDGTIVITNSVQYVLPESGGPGTMMYTLGGLGLCGLAVLGYRPKRRRKEDPAS